MSMLNQSGEELVECPLCMEALEVDDLHFYPCTCGYQICRFCWNRIREGENGLCPACRKAYPENPADFTPLSQEQVAAIKTEKKAREQKRRNKTLESRRALANVRVVQNNLVFVVGLPVRLADPEILKRQEYFGKYGKIHKVVINQSTTYAGQQFPQGPSASAYVTYVSMADALRAIQGVNNVTLDGRVLKGSLGTTKYCANFMKNQPCPKPDCMYLHELGDPKASFTKEEMHAGLHQVYERKLHNQLLQSTLNSKNDTSGNSSVNESKSSSKDGNQSNLIPATVVASSNINVVNSSKSKKERNDSNSNSNGNGSSSNGNGSTSNGKEAWPSLGSSPPSDSPARKQSSPKPQQSSANKSQENGLSSASSTSESSSPVQLQTQQPAQTKTKTKDTQHTKTNRNKENSTNGKSKKNKDKSKEKTSVSISSETDSDEHKPTEERESKTYTSTQNKVSVFENDTQYLTNELDELESDRHSLLENHDLLDNSDHSLLEDDNTHNLLNDANNEVMMMHRHKEMLAGLVDSNHIMKSPVLNGFGLLDRDMGYLDRQISQISQGLVDQKDLLMRDRTQSELLMRQNEMMARQHSVLGDPKRFMPSSSIGLDSTSELLGANFHQNPNMLPPFGMRVDNSMGTTSGMGGGGLPASLSANMSSNMSGGLSAGSLGSYMLHGQQMMHNQQQMQQSGLVNGYDTSQANSEGRYLAENMDKFFTDFHKAQQMRQQLNRGSDERRYRGHHFSQHVLNAERLEGEHKQRISGVRGGESGGHRAAGDGDDDLDFDPFKETQKAFAELMETEMMQNQVSSGDNVVQRSRVAPPGFTNHTAVSSFGLGAPRHHSQHQGYMNNNSSSSPIFSDWTQMDPAIMSVNFSKNPPLVPPTPTPSLTQQQQELFARFNHLGINQSNGINQPNGIKNPFVTAPHWQPPAQKLSWSAAPYNSIPLPPGFAPAKSSQHPAECIDAK